MWYSDDGATDKRQAGGSPPRFAEGKRLFVPSDTRKGGLRQMVTYPDLIQLGILIVGIISLFIQASNKKK